VINHQGVLIENPGGCWAQAISYVEKVLVVKKFMEKGEIHNNNRRKLPKSKEKGGAFSF